MCSMPPLLDVTLRPILKCSKHHEQADGILRLRTAVMPWDCSWSAATSDRITGEWYRAGRSPPDFLRSWRAYFLLQTGRRQLPEVPEIERVNTFYRAPCRAAQQQSVVNFRADPSAACHRVQCLQIVLFAEGYDLKMRQDVLGDDARRFNRMYARLDRQARECGKHFRDRVQAHKSLVLPRGDAQQRRPGLRVVRMALLGGGNENCRIEENIHSGYAFKTDSIRSSRTSSRMRSQFAPGSALP